MTHTVGSTYHPGSCQMDYRYDYDGSDYFWQSKTYIASTAFSSPWTKTSVDTGVFVPNVYRVNPYSVSRWLVQSGFTAASYTEPKGTSITAKINVSGNLFQYGLMSTLSTKGAKTSNGRAAGYALEKAYSNLDPSIADFGEDIGEIRETFQTLTNPFRSLRRFAKRRNLPQVRKDLQRWSDTGRYKRLVGKEAAEAAADVWMEIRYGIRPIIYSIANILEVLADEGIKLDPNRIRTARGAYKMSLGSESYSDLQLQTVGIATCYGDVKHKAYEKANAAIQYLWTGTGQISLCEKMGLTYRHFPETAWALASRSFVFDWWLDIGSFLEANRFVHPDVKILGNTVGTKTTNTFEVKGGYVQTTLNNPKNPHSLSSTEKLQVESYTRDVDVERPYLPTWVGGQYMDWKKTIDMLIVLYQSVKM